MSQATINIREAVCNDAGGIAQVQVDSWRSSYRGIVPAGYLAQLSYEQREKHWVGILGDAGSPIFAYVAENAVGQIVGFAAGGPERTGQSIYKGELYSIYLLEEYQKLGVGQQLFTCIKRRLYKSFGSMLLWVLTENVQARKFYEKMGGELVQTQKFEIGGAILEETGYGWTRID